MKPIVVVGSINMDLVSQTERIPKPGETLIGTSFQLHSGGKGANQAVAVARLGYPSTLLGVLGDDIFGTQLLATLQGFGVDMSHAGFVAGSSGTASIVVDARGENTIIVTPGSNLQVTPTYLRSKLDVLRSAGMILAQLEVPIETVEWLAQFCAESGVPLMLDPAPAQVLPAELLAGVTWLTPNQTEAAFYAANSESTEDMLGRLFAQGVANVILKEGSDGAVVATADGVRKRVQAFPVDVLDTTAAGDAFNGAFAVALMRNLPLEECARFAAAAAAISVTRNGAQSSLASGEEVLAFLRSSS
jgi:ribokinase